MSNCPKCHRPINEGNSANRQECTETDDDEGLCEAYALVAAQQAYIDYLIEADGQTAVYLHIHNWKWPDEFIARGEALRAKLKELQ